LAIRRKAGVQRRIAGGANMSERRRIIEEKRSMTLNTSPVRMKRPFNRRRPAQKRTR